MRIVAEGDAATNLLIVRRGAARVVKHRTDGRRMVIDFVGPGEVIDPIAGIAHTASAEAIVPTRIASIPRAALREAIVADPAVRERLSALANAYSARLERQLLAIGRANGLERLAGFLVDRVRRHEALFGPAGTLSRDIPLPMGRADIADHLGLRVETVSRLLADLRGAGIVDRIANDRLRILDFDRLVAAANE